MPALTLRNSAPALPEGLKMGALAAAETPFDSEAVFPVSLPLPTPTPLAENTAAELFSLY